MAANKACQVTQKPRSNIQDSLCRHCLVLVFTVVLTSFFGISVGLHDVKFVNEEHVPTLKEIFGEVPPNSLPLMHRDSTDSTLRKEESDNETSFERAERIARSLRRGLRRKLSSPYEIEGQVSDAGFSPLNALSSAYYVKLQMGSPVQDLLMLIDTGSSDFWVQSAHCESCNSSNLLPSYDSNISSTFQYEKTNGSFSPWQISYGDNSSSSGFIVSDKLTIDSGYGNQIVIPDFEFGLASSLTNMNSMISSGILGLGQLQGPNSPPPFLTLLGSISNGTYSTLSTKFRHCFTDRLNQAKATSFLSFGDINESDSNSLYSSGKHLYLNKTQWTPIIPNPNNDYYALNLTAISVAGTRIAINPAELTVESVMNNTFKSVLDSGTSITGLREPYFSQFLSAYYNASVNLGATITYNPKLEGLPGVPLMVFNISKDVFDATVFPSVSFIFQKWHPEGEQEEEEIEFFQPKDNLIIPYSVNVNNSDPFYILNLVNYGDNVNTIGNYAQQNYLIEFDLEKARVGFLRASCAFEY